MLQLVLFVRTVECLSADQITMYAQDPRFTSADEQLFESLGIQVVRPPQGEALVDNTSLVVRSLHTDPARTYVLDILFIAHAVHLHRA